jgi:hypothetical protein
MHTAAIAASSDRLFGCESTQAWMQAHFLDASGYVYCSDIELQFFVQLGSQADGNIS